MSKNNNYLVEICFKNAKLPLIERDLNFITAKKLFNSTGQCVSKRIILDGHTIKEEMGGKIIENITI